MALVRRELATCWPARPSLRALAPGERALFDSGMRVAAGGPWDLGELHLAIEAANSTLDAHGHERPAGSGLQQWTLGRVDPAARLTPAPEQSNVLRAAISAAEAMREAIHHRLDEITRIAPPETWLPEWSLDDARRYIASVRWRHARPPQPPHEYTIRDWRPDLRRDFLAIAQSGPEQGCPQEMA